MLLGFAEAARLRSTLPSYHPTQAARLHELAFDVPLDRLLLASAAPRNLPTQARGGRKSLCHPGHIVFTAERLVELKRGNVELQQLFEAARENSRTVYGV